MKKIFYNIALLIVFVIFIFISVVSNFLYPIDTFITDRLYSRLNGANPNIIIVSVDEETLSEYGNFTLWSREKLAELIDKLYENKENAPAVVAMDFILSDDYEQDADKHLAESAKGHNIIVGTNIVYRGAVEINSDGSKYFNREHINDVEMPYEALKAVTIQGFTNQYISSDGYVRCGRNNIIFPEVLRETAGNSQNSFSMSVYKAYQNYIGEEATTPKTNPEGPFIFSYSGKSGEFPKVSLNAVLNDKIPMSVFKDAIVMVGAYAPGFQDSFQPSSDRGKVMYGIEIHANIVQAYIEGKTMVMMNKYLMATIISIIIVAFLLICRNRILFITIPASIGVASIYAIAGRILSGKGIYISCIYMLAALILADLYFILEKYLQELIANLNYQKEIKEQMWSFTEAMATAIDQRTPYNATHTRNVAKYSGMIADYVNELHKHGKEEEYFTTQRKEQLVLAALMHDIGKIAIPLSVMNKETRLNGREKDIERRLEVLRLKSQVEMLENKISEQSYNEMVRKINSSIELMNRVNGIGFLNEEDREKIKAMLDYKYTDAEGNSEDFFTEEEKECLSIIKGTLTDKEREIMQSHVVITSKILDKVHFNKYFEKAPIIAAQHHECLNGKGYPNGISAEDLCTDSRIIAVADICDALLADDRPYKRPLSREKAFDIMRNMAKDGNIDGKYVEYLYECTR